jgi:hypothetical protein
MRVHVCVCACAYERDLCVWTVVVQRVPADRGYWEAALLPALARFYHDRFVPAYVARPDIYIYIYLSIYLPIL